MYSKSSRLRVPTAVARSALLIDIVHCHHSLDTLSAQTLEMGTKNCKVICWEVQPTSSVPHTMEPHWCVHWCMSCHSFWCWIHLPGSYWILDTPLSRKFLFSLCSQHQPLVTIFFISYSIFSCMIPLQAYDTENREMGWMTYCVLKAAWYCIFSPYFI